MEIRVGNKSSVLDKVYVNDFGDNYHRTDLDPSTELERQVRRIRRRYKNVSDFIEASAAYNEYMGLLILKYGGPELFKIKMKEEEIEDFIPPRPRMKNTPLNRYYMKHQILVSHINRKEFNEELLKEIEREYEKGTPEEMYIFEDVDPEIAKMAKKGDFASVKTRELRDIHDFDYLEAFFRTKNVKAHEKTKEQFSKLSLTDLINGEKLDKLRDTSYEDDIVLYKGRYMNREAVEELQVYHQLAEAGWNSLKMMREQKVSKKVRQVMKDSIKHKKKKNKKKNKRAHEATSNFFVDLAGDNGFDSFEEFQNEMLNMRSDDIFR